VPGRVVRRRVSRDVEYVLYLITVAFIDPDTGQERRKRFRCTRRFFKLHPSGSAVGVQRRRFLGVLWWQWAVVR
jgi:hypothetical protein